MIGPPWTKVLLIHKLAVLIVNYQVIMAKYNFTNYSKLLAFSKHLPQQGTIPINCC